MSDDPFYQDLRRFLKRFGVTAQQEIEEAVRVARAAGTLDEAEPLLARAHLTVAGLELDLTIEQEIRLG